MASMAKRKQKNKEPKIEITWKEIKRQKNEFKVLTASMAEGLVLLNAEGTVLSINHAAEKLFEVGSACVGQDLLAVTGNQELAGLLRQAKEYNRRQQQEDKDTDQAFIQRDGVIC